MSFLVALYFGMKGLEYSHEDKIIKGISVGVKDERKEKAKKPEAKKETKKIKKKPKNKPAKKKVAKPKDIIKPKTPPLKNKSKHKINPPSFKKEQRPSKPQKEEAPLSIRKIYQNDAFTDDIDSLDLPAVYTRSIKTHLNFCFSRILEGQNKDLEMVEEIEVVFDMSKRGVIKFDFKRNIDENLLSDNKFANYKEILDKIDSATSNCAIFRNLPVDKYDIWREFKVLFTSKK